jgi:hypothetical protein
MGTSGLASYQHQLEHRHKPLRSTPASRCVCLPNLQLFTVLCRLPPSFAVFHDATKSCMLLEELCRQPQQVRGQLPAVERGTKAALLVVGKDGR